MSLKDKILRIFDNLYIKDCRCIICNREIARGSRYCMCDNCRNHLPIIHNPCHKCGGDIPSGNVCTNCKSILPAFERNIVALNYTPPITTLVYKLKFENAKYLAPYLGNILVDTYMSSGLDIDYIIPVPIHTNRLKERGYNQTELLVKSFDKVCVPYRLDVVERVIDTPHQTTLPRDKRLLNLDGAFKVVKKSDVKGKSILIVDDVYTTGATLNELARVLYKAHAKHIYGLVLAHGEYRLLTESK